MIRTIISNLVLVCYALTASAEATYYYSNSKKIPLYENTSKAIVKSEKSSTNVLYGLPTFSALRSMSCEDYDITVVQKNDTLSLDALAKKVLTPSSTIRVYPCYKDEAGSDMIPTSYIYVELKSVSDYTKLRSMAQSLGCSIVKQNKSMPLWYTLCLSSTSSGNSVEIANKIMETEQFSNACPAFEITSSISYDPAVLDQWGLYNSEYEDVDISASEAWNYATGRGVTVAVIDTGVDLSHEDLSDNLLPISYDAISGTSPSIIYEGQSHGTICAGIIGAIRNNNKGLSGVAPDVKLMSVSAALGTPDAEDQLADGIIWAYTHGADILSCSWGRRGESPIIAQAIDKALANGRNGKGCVMVCAAGNGFIAPAVIFPANYKEDIIAVGNIRKSGLWNETSAIGDTLFICAPGTDIFSTLPYNTYGDTNEDGPNTGTSMACPHVSGTVALMLEINPDLTISQIREILAKTSKKIGHEPYSTLKTYGKWNECYGYGLVDAAEAVKSSLSK